MNAVIARGLSRPRAELLTLDLREAFLVDFRIFGEDIVILGVHDASNIDRWRAFASGWMARS